MKLKPCPSCVTGNRAKCRKCSQTGFARKQPAYLAYVRTRPCASCGAHPPSEAHHEYLDRNEKAFGQRALPLCRSCHRQRTDATRDAFWSDQVGRLAYWMDAMREAFERGKETP